MRGRNLKLKIEDLKWKKEEIYHEEREGRKAEG